MELLGIDIGGTKCAVIRGNEKGEILVKEVMPTTSVEETLDWIIETAVRLKGDSRAAGISCGGPLDSDKGVILSPPNLPGWDEIEIVKMLEDRLGIPAYLCNDANACAVAEWKFGAGRGFKNIILLTFGTGLGAGLILDGRLYNGTNGNAGEVGHIRLADFGPAGYGKQGSFEGFASGGGIALSGKMFAIEALQQGKKPLYCDDLSKLDTVSAKSIADAANKGDETAIAVYKSTGAMLGKGVSILIDVLNPERIVIGSIFQRSENLLRDAMEDVIKKETLTASRNAVKVVPAELGDNLGDCAALALALMCYENHK
jgi:glucokinase